METPKPSTILCLLENTNLPCRLQDNIRTGTYRDAIVNNTSDFTDAVVVDVGAGTGILSFFAAQVIEPSIIRRTTKQNLHFRARRLTTRIHIHVSLCVIPHFALVCWIFVLALGWSTKSVCCRSKFYGCPCKDSGGNQWLRQTYRSHLRKSRRSGHQGEGLTFLMFKSAICCQSPSKTLGFSSLPITFITRPTLSSASRWASC